MFVDSINLAEGSNIGTFNIARGTSFPSNANEAELFFRTDESIMYTYDGTEWISIGTGSSAAVVSPVPKITSIAVTDSSYGVLDDTAVDIAGGYIKLTGTNFVAGCVVIVGSDNATSTTFVSATEVRAQVPAKAAGTYIVYLVNADGGVATRVNGLTYSALPSWTTNSTLPGQNAGANISIQLAATGATSYAVQQGSTLPTGLSMTGAGLITGSVTGISSPTQYTFTIVAIDAQNQDSPRTFSLTISPV